MKKALTFTPVFASFLFISAAYAGGSGTSWHPSVEPINCVSSNTHYFFWNNKNACNEVIEKNYAKGVHYSGEFKYTDGSSLGFSGYITPYQTYTPPSHPEGKKLAYLANTQWYWAK